MLLHAAAGGVGLAALQLAAAGGAEVFATAGSARKRGVLRGLGIRHVLDSRSAMFVEALAQARCPLQASIWPHIHSRADLCSVDRRCLVSVAANALTVWGRNLPVQVC